jgi:hypothetical protein
VLRATSYSSPSTVYAAAYTTAPTDSTSGTEVTTAGGTLYARVAITFGAASGGSISNSADIQFPVAGASWGTIVGIAITDNATAGAGNVLYYDGGITSVAISANDRLVIPSGSLTVTQT